MKWHSPYWNYHTTNGNVNDFESITHRLMNASVKKFQHLVSNELISLPFSSFLTIPSRAGARHIGWPAHSIECNSFNQKRMPYAHITPSLSLYLLCENIENVSRSFYVEIRQNISMNYLIRVKLCKNVCVHRNGINRTQLNPKVFNFFLISFIYIYIYPYFMYRFFFIFCLHIICI